MDNCYYETVIKTEDGNDQTEEQVTFENGCPKTLDRNTYNIGEIIVKEEKDLIDGYCFESVIEIEKNDILDKKLMTNYDLDKIQPFVCDICHQTMTTKKKMARHIARSHNKHSSQKNSGKQSVKNTFSIREIIVKEEKDLIDGYCFESVIEFEKNDNDLDKIQPFVCNICHQTTTTKRKMARHISRSHNKHSSQKNSGKQSVKKTFRLTKHKRMHTVKKPHKCGVCLKSYSSSSALSRHKRVHTGEKPHKCDACLKLFSTSTHLKLHQRVHTGEKPYKCVVCLKCFSRKPHLELHKRVHTGEKPYKCVVCPKSFPCSSSFKSHKRVHTGEKPYKCDVCAKLFTYSCSLKKHKRLHTGEKPYKCDVCAKTFFHSSSLKLHERVHTGQKPYKCDVCLKCFSLKPNLKRHERVHTR